MSTISKHKNSRKDKGSPKKDTWVTLPFLAQFEENYRKNNPRPYLYHTWNQDFVEKATLAVRNKEIQLTAGELYNLTFNLLMWCHLPFSYILESGKFIFLYPYFAKFRLDIREDNLKRLLKEAHHNGIESMKEGFAQDKNVAIHLNIDYHRKKTRNYVGLSVVYKSPFMPEGQFGLHVLDVIQFEDRSPEARVWLSEVTEVLRKFGITTTAIVDKIASITYYIKNEDYEPNDDDKVTPLNDLKKHFEKLFQKSVPCTFHGEEIRARVELRVEFGVIHLEQMRIRLIEATLKGEDGPELIKETMYFRINDVTDYIIYIDGDLLL